jgi:hypothetical protein
VLGGAAMAGAASLILPAVDLAAGLSPGPSPSSRFIGSLSGLSAPLAAPRRFSLVGIQWTASAGKPAASIELRTRRGDGTWGRWASASTLGHGPDRVEDPAQLFGAPVWSGLADYVQLRSSAPVAGVRVHFVSVAPERSARAAAALPLAAPALDAGPGQPPIIARRGWAGETARPAAPPGYGTVKLAFVHHSETPNGYFAAEVPAILMSIYVYHRYIQGWFDIGYNFAVDAFGRIWEARAGGTDLPVIGAHAGGYNAVSTGTVILGSFVDVLPSAAAINALERLLAWKLSLHGSRTYGRVTVRVSAAGAKYSPYAPGAPVSLPRVAGHRDGDSTSCPGDALYARLPAIRPRITSLAGTPVRLTLQARPTAVTAGAPVELSGRLAQVSGGPLGDATIELQSHSFPGLPVSIATVLTGADGRFSIPLTLGESLVVGALRRSRPAAVSDPVRIEVAPVLTLTVDSTAPLRVSGTVTPAKRTVTIDLYSVGPRGRRRLVRSRRVAVKQGRFAAVLLTLRPGRHALVARTAADAQNAPGASAVVELTTA